MSKKRLCLIGNSHAAAVKGGVDLQPALNDQYNFEFFAAQSDLMRDMELRGSTLVPTTEITKRRMGMLTRGKSQIETADYDAFVIAGLGFNMLESVNALKNFKLYGFHKEAATATPFLSRACFAALVESALRASTAVYFARMIRTVSKARIIIIPQPYPSADILKNGLWKYASKSGLLAYVVAEYEKISSKLAAELQCEIMFQPEQTLLQEGITQAKYSVDSVRLGGNMGIKHPPGESAHMNALYGVEILEKLDAMIQV